MADGENETTIKNVVDPAVQEAEDKNNGWDGEFDPERYKADLSKKNAENKSLRERLKKFEEAEAAKQAKKDAKNTQNQSTEERVAALAESNKKLQQQLWQRDVRDEVGLTPAQMKYITGDTLEELKANAEAFKKDVLGAGADNKDEDEFEMTEEQIEAATRELSPLGGNRRPNKDVSRSRATAEGAAAPAFDPDKLAAEIMKSPWG